MKNEIMPREFDLRRKLSDEDITKIKEMNSNGFSLRKISEIMGVAARTVKVHCMSEEEKEEYYKKKYLTDSKYRKETSTASSQRSREREKLICPDVLRESNRLAVQRFRAKTFK